MVFPEPTTHNLCIVAILVGLPTITLYTLMALVARTSTVRFTLGVSLAN